jgi:hypothetical protein
MSDNVLLVPPTIATVLLPISLVLLAKCRRLCCFSLSQVYFSNRALEVVGGDQKVKLEEVIECQES